MLEMGPFRPVYKPCFFRTDFLAQPLLCRPLCSTRPVRSGCLVTPYRLAPGSSPERSRLSLPPTPLLLLSLFFSSFDPPTSSPAQSLLSPAGLLSLFGSSHSLSFTSVPATSVPQKLLHLVTVHRVLFSASVPSPIQPLCEVRGDGSSLRTWNEDQRRNFGSPRHAL